MIKTEPYDCKIDYWALGILTYEFLVGSPPFEVSHSNKHKCYEKIKNLDYTFPDFLSDLAKDFITKLLKIDPADRMNLEEALAHEWILKNA